VGRVDCLWREAKVIVELDGRRFHGGAMARDADRRRDNRLFAGGWTVLRFTWWDIQERPDEVVGLVRRALLARARVRPATSTIPPPEPLLL
jgi:very-short-patch-repair endonuclease